MGLLDLPSEVLSRFDAAIGGLPPTARIVVWGGVGAVLSMGSYWLASPQGRIAGMVAEERHLKATLRRDDLMMNEGLGAARRLLVLALTRIGLVTGPALISAVPVLCLMAWLQTYYAHELPGPGQIPAVQVHPSVLKARWIAEEGRVPRVEIADDRGGVVQSVPLRAPVPVVHKRAWWNALVGNPLGYLADDGPAERVEIGLPEKRYLWIGPDWMRGWETPFLVTLLAVSFALKLALRIR
jgi:hypothetical protein